ncbi:MAG: cation:proton antiporter [Rhodobacteraceae bacterium]|nr:cation:proton antiporter [Paracoccaceae bacterium]
MEQSIGEIESAIETAVTAHESAVGELVIVVVLLLLIAAGVRAVSKTAQFPFTVLLVLFGVAVAELSSLDFVQASGLLNLQLSRDAILYVFLPTLIFESAFHMDVRHLRDNIGPILLLAVPGLLISTGLIAGMVAATTAIPFVAALVLGAILSATDPVAVIALFRQMGAPQRLTYLVEGESLFNDATAIVTANILLAVAVSGTVTAATAASGAIDFVVVFCGGALVGTGLGLLTGWLLGLVHDDSAIEISLMTVLAYFSFIIAEELFHVSGVMATLSAGLIMGNWGRTKVSPSVAVYVENFWEYAAYVANALIFLLVGLRVDFGGLVGEWTTVAWVIVAMLISRALVIGGLMPMVGLMPNAVNVNWRYQAIMYWGGLRGAVALAVALSLGDFPYADIFVTAVMGAVLFTLLINGLTVEPLMHLLKLDKPSPTSELVQREAELKAVEKAIDGMNQMNSTGLLFERVTKSVDQRRRKEIEDIKAQIIRLRADVSNTADERSLVYLRCLGIEKVIYYSLLAKHQLSEHAYRRLSHSSDLQIEAMRHGGALPRRTYYETWTHRLATVVRSALAHLPWSRRWAEIALARDYEIAWGRCQAAEQILAFIGELKEAGSYNSEIISELEARYRQWNVGARERLDSWAAQFPQFVEDMQELLAERLILAVEIDIVSQDMDSGLIPHSAGHGMLDALRDRIRRLRIPSMSVADADPEELLKTIPFMATLQHDQIAALAHLLRPHNVAADTEVIRQGEAGRSLFIISRGVIRVDRFIGDRKERVATLVAGDFFGDDAFNTGEPRTVRCKAVTACALYELKRQDFDRVVGLGGNA